MDYVHLGAGSSLRSTVEHYNDKRPAYRRQLADTAHRFGSRLAEMPPTGIEPAHAV